jgi:hypothetical protein
MVRVLKSGGVVASVEKGSIERSISRPREVDEGCKRGGDELESYRGTDFRGVDSREARPSWSILVHNVRFRDNPSIVDLSTNTVIFRQAGDDNYFKCSSQLQQFAPLPWHNDWDR